MLCGRADPFSTRLRHTLVASGAPCIGASFRGVGGPEETHRNAVDETPCDVLTHERLGLDSVDFAAQGLIVRHPRVCPTTCRSAANAKVSFERTTAARSRWRSPRRRGTARLRADASGVRLLQRPVGQHRSIHRAARSSFMRYLTSETPRVTDGLSRDGA